MYQKPSNNILFLAFKVGQCTLDTFSIASPGGPGTPQICGTNSGYHSKFNHY